VRELLRGVRGGERRFDARAILARISLAKNAFVAPADYAPREADAYDEMTAEIYPKYQRALRAFAALDFDDLIAETVRLLDGDRAARRRWSAAFDHVLVDEFQDANRAQLLLVRHLAPHGNLCVVGDDDQSIYAWRGADPTNVLQFEAMFPGATAIALEQNYRSTPQILAAANAVIAHNRDRRAKTLFTDRPDGPRVAEVVLERPEDEAAHVAGCIEALRAAGRRFGDVAVLYRSNVQTRPIEEALRERQIPYAMFGGQQFYERKEVKDVLAYLRAALSARDEISLRRVINYPARGIGATTVERAAAWAQARGATLWTALQRIDEVEGVAGPSRRAVAGFVGMIERLQGALSTSGVEAATRQLVTDIGLVADLRAASPSPEAAQRRIDNVTDLVRALGRHTGGRAALMEYLRRMALDANDDDAGADAGDRVALATLHGAKGLEFPVVFLVGAEEELLPHWRTIAPTAADVDDSEHAADVSEERRLVYVGITRAREQLTITRCRKRRKHGKDVERAPSRFLREIPDALLDTRDIAAEQTAPVPTDELRSFLRTFGD
jgi:DNA helicase-2/ATP-dependent DNA helicase PcrA